MATGRVLLVRHSMPETSPDLAPEDWALGDPGRAAARALRPRLPAGATWVSSEERKAFETLMSARPQPDVVVVRDVRLGEVRRPGEPFDDDVVARRLAWVEGRPDHRHVGWEEPEEAAARFDEAVREHLARSSGALVIGTHGMVCVAWLVQVGEVRAGAEAGDRWASLGLPAVVEVVM